MFAAKYRTNSIAQIFSLAGKDLSGPINSKETKTREEAIGQTEEKIYAYLESIGIPKRKANEVKTIGIIYTDYSEIAKPDTAPLSKDFNPTFLETLWDNP